MLTLTATIQKITDGNYMAFELAYYAPGRKEPLKVNKHIGESADDVVFTLKKDIERFPPQTKFEISVKKNGRDTADTAHVWQFTNSEVQQSAPGWPSPFMPQQAGFSGFGGIGSMYDVSDLKDEKRRLDDLKDSLNDLKLRLTVQELELKRDKENFEKEVKEAKQNLSELEKKYNSTAGAAQKGAEMLLGEVITGFAQDGNFGRFGSKLMGLGNANALGGEEESESTPEREEIESIAADIDNLGLSLDQLKKLHAMINKTASGFKKGGAE